MRIGVGAIVTGSGSYSITVSSVGGSSGVYGAALVVVYSQPTEPFARIIIQDGAEFIRADVGNSPYRVSFSGISTTSAVAASLTVMAQAGQPAATRPDERDELRVGNVVIDNDPFRSDDGYLWDVNSWNVFAQLESMVDVDFYESGTQPPGLNGYAIDFVLLALTYAAPFPGVPEFSLGLPIMTSLALVLFLVVEKRFGKRRK